MSERYDFIILGAGLAGLTAARELAQAGQRVLLVEKSAETGGLARTINHNGFRFDIGSHRFGRSNPQVVSWLHKLLRDDLITVSRRSHIYLDKRRQIEYPIKLPDALNAFSLGEMAHMAASYLMANVAGRFRQAQSFEDWIVKRFGWPLYRTFFQPYAQKLWGIPCDQLSADLAVQQAGLSSFSRLIQQAVQPVESQPTSPDSDFFYPREGIGMLTKALTQAFLFAGGALATESSAVRIQRHGNHYHVMLQPSAETIVADHVISTIPLPSLLAVLPDGDAQQPRLDYRGLICIFLSFNKKQIGNDCWTYFPADSIHFGRICEPKNWSPLMVPDARKTSLCVELFANPQDPLWSQSDDDLVKQVMKELYRLGLAKRRELIAAGVLRKPQAHPIYRVGYHKQLAATRRFLARFNNLHLLGRVGTFSHKQNDELVEQTLTYLAQQGWITSAEIGQPAAEKRWA